MKKIITLIAAAIVFVACSSPTPQKAVKSVVRVQPAVKQYPMHGKVLSLDPSAKKARIDAGPIGDWMPSAMTMNYLVKDDAEFAKLSAGETIDVTVFVKSDDDYWIGEIKPAK